ncbi:MAG: hypothetical protein COB04_01495 [Gammaproteobacteria bacterium]|nr:MAG: hypothetical protein COB04_01495 [Gammaproteobacteria bacterium]
MINLTGKVVKSFINSPATKLSSGLVMLTICLLLTSEFIGLVPDTKHAELQSRKVITETLAVQLSMDLQNEAIDSIKDTLRSAVKRNSSVRSGSVRLVSGKLIAEVGEHQEFWKLKPGDKSSMSQIQVSLFNGNKRWGNVELRFVEIGVGSDWLAFKGSFLVLILFVGLIGFFAYRMFLTRALRELDPDAVIPERVRKALDTLAEGLLIVDKEGVIIFSNEAFAKKTGYVPEQLVGKESSGLDWQMCGAEGQAEVLPWAHVLNGEELPKGVRIKLTTALNATYTFTVNVSPITTSSRKKVKRKHTHSTSDASHNLSDSAVSDATMIEEVRGALITFDDITELEIKNKELREAFEKLEESKQEILRQNHELLVLATRDPLTDLLNRRSLFESFDSLLAEAQEDQSPLCCIMVDIDHFKAVNDNFGHAVGDKVIKVVANILIETARQIDIVGRFGGEEFVVILPGLDIKGAANVGERIRQVIEGVDGNSFPGLPSITSSFGVSTLTPQIGSSNELLELADKALYVAKESGRNRVISWSDALEKEAAKSAPPSDSQKEKVEHVTLVRESGRSDSPSSNIEAIQNTDQENLTDSKGEGDLNTATNEAVFEAVATDSEPKTIKCPPDKVVLLERTQQALKRAKKYQRKVVLLHVDIDALQRVNDSLGLLSAEKFAKNLVARIKESLSKLEDKNANGTAQEQALSFSVSRFNGNEIVVLLPDLAPTAVVTRFIYEIFAANKKPVVVEGSEFYLNTNIGVSAYPANGVSPEELLKNASSAMQEAKRKLDRNNFQFYSNDLSIRTQKLIRLEAELHRAEERDELSVYYQPKMCLKTGTIVGVEALLRWHHPEFGVVPPDEFILLAEQTGLINDIGRWVLRTVCRQIKFWEELGYGKVSVSINLSPVEFRNPDLADHIISEARESGISPSTLELEITETIVLQNVDAAVVVLEKLSNAGFIITLDDFGTGFSSLSYLKLFPVSKIKIDRSFIKDFIVNSDDAVIVSAIIAMSHSLELEVVAEGVETEEQLRFLQDLHCDEVQGYLFAGALHTEKVTNLLADPNIIRRMILDYRDKNIVLMDSKEKDSATGMIDTLNHYVANDGRKR